MAHSQDHGSYSSNTEHRRVDKNALRFFPLVLIFFETTLYLSNDMYLPSMPLIADELFLTQNQTQLTLIFWFIGASSLQLVLGPLSDRYGRKKITVISCILFILSSAACAMSTGLWLFLLARFIQGTAICALLATYAAVHELYSSKQAIKLIAMITAVTILAPAFGPLIGAVIVQFAHWTYIFWLLSVMGLCSLWSILKYMPESNTEQSSIKINKVLRDYANIITNKKFLWPSFGYFLLIFIEFAWIFESPFIIIEVFNKSTMFYGVTQSIIFSSYFVGAIVTKILLDRCSIAQFMKISLFITTAGVMMLLLIGIFFNHLLLAIISIIIISFGSSMLFGPLNRIATEACTEPMGRRMAIFLNGISLSGVAIGFILNVMNTETLFALSMLMAICMVFAFVVIWKTIITNQH